MRWKETRDLMFGEVDAELMALCSMEIQIFVDPTALDEDRRSSRKFRSTNHVLGVVSEPT
jgi:hypothetical protein